MHQKGKADTDDEADHLKADTDRTLRVLLRPLFKPHLIPKLVLNHGIHFGPA